MVAERRVGIYELELKSGPIPADSLKDALSVHGASMHQLVAWTYRPFTKEEAEQFCIEFDEMEPA